MRVPDMDPDEQAIRNLVTTWMSASAAGDRDRVLELIDANMLASVTE